MRGREERGEASPEVIERFEGHLKFTTGKIIGADEEPVSLIGGELFNYEEAYPYERCGFSEIQEYLGVVSSFKLGRELVEQLGFEDLQWGFYEDPEAKDLLFVGVADSEDKGSVNRAEGSIIVERVYNRDRDEPVSPYDISVAGYREDLGRIVTASYSAEDGSCCKFHISLSGFEGKRTGFGFLLEDIPTFFDYSPYSAGGLVTEGMVDRTAEDGDEHVGVLRFSTGSRDYREIRPEYAAKLLLKVYQEEDSHVVKFQKPYWKLDRGYDEAVREVFDGIHIPLFLEQG